MLTFRIIYFNDEGNQSYIIRATSKLDFESQLNNFLKLNNLTKEQINIECISSII